MSKIDALLAEYSRSHKNPLNKKIHRIFVPLIFWSLFAIVWSISPTSSLFIYGLILAVYFSWGLKIGVRMLMLGGLCFISCIAIDFLAVPLLPVGGSIFCVSWVAQFYGHHVEGERPSFLTDLKFLLVGPLWVLDDLLN